MCERMVTYQHVRSAEARLDGIEIFGVGNRARQTSGFHHRMSELVLILPDPVDGFCTVGVPLPQTIEALDLAVIDRSKPKT